MAKRKFESMEEYDEEEEGGTMIKIKNPKNPETPEIKEENLIGEICSFFSKVYCFILVF